MPRVTLILSLLLCCTAAAVRAEESKPGSGAVPPLPHKIFRQAAARRKAKPAQARAATAPVQPIVGSGADVQTGAALADPARSPDGAAAWSVSPKWSAGNGGTTAAYGTRALVNEFHANPAETTGYGAGAQVDFHF